MLVVWRCPARLATSEKKEQASTEAYCKNVNCGEFFSIHNL